MNEYKVNVSQIRELAGHYAAGELEDCIQDVLGSGTNTCELTGDQAEVISLLSMAGFVRARMEQEDLSLSQALRILGRRMRRVVGAQVKKSINKSDSIDPTVSG